jgi:PII-like signaling protein
MKIPEQGVLLRIFVDENDHHKGTLTYERIVMKARELNLAGATVTKGIMGFGADSKIHTTKILRLSDHLPVVIEIVDKEEKINQLIPYLDEIVKEGLITMENVRVIKYRHD